VGWIAAPVEFVESDFRESLGEAVAAGEGEGLAAGVAVGDATAADWTRIREGVVMVGNTEPFKMPAAKRMNSREAKIPP
jgi:hypothetical protein